MDDKCTHESAEVQASYGDLTIMRCTWDCGQFYVQTGTPMNVRTFTAADLARLQVVKKAAREFLETMKYETALNRLQSKCAAELAAALDAADTKP
jgi:nitrite reductase/ring-hydroxylating ferredoxin subunit